MLTHAQQCSKTVDTIEVTEYNYSRNKVTSLLLPTSINQNRALKQEYSH